MSASLSTFKKMRAMVGNAFAVFSIVAFTFFGSIFCVAILSALLTRLGVEEGSNFWIFANVGVLASVNLTVLAIWLFKVFGGRPGFISFCNRHPRCKKAVLRAIDAGRAVGHGIGIVAAVTAKNTESFVTWVIEGPIGNAAAWLMQSVFVLLFLVIGGVILYSIAGALSAPWWALVIIYLLMTKK